jgi:cytochrome c oxidase subunit 2
MNELLREVLDLPLQASTFARDIDTLHFFIILTTLAGSSIVGLATVYFVIRYRRRPGDGLTPRIRISPIVEAVWISVLLVLFTLWWVIGYRQYIRIYSPPRDAIDVYVTAKQWMWQFSYPNGKSSIAVLTVPAGRAVRLNMTSRDVIHSFSVPAFRIKADVIPGRYRGVWFEAITPGTYQVLCAEFCGVSHSTMWADVVVLNAEDYESWLNGDQPIAERRGEQINSAQREASKQLKNESWTPFGARGGEATSMTDYGRDAAVRHGCFACHTVTGEQHIGPTWLGLYGRWVTLSDGSRVLADDAYLTESMMDPKAKIVRGYQPLMPTFQGLLTPPETAGLVEFIKSLRAGETDGNFPARPLENLRAPNLYDSGYDTGG